MLFGATHLQWWRFEHFHRECAKIAVLQWVGRVKGAQQEKQVQAANTRARESVATI